MQLYGRSKAILVKTRRGFIALRPAQDLENFVIDVQTDNSARAGVTMPSGSISTESTTLKKMSDSVEMPESPSQNPNGH